MTAIDISMRSLGMSDRTSKISGLSSIPKASVKRLALSQARCDQMHELSRKLGLAKREDEQEKLTGRECAVESRIMNTKPLTRADFEKKLAIHDQYARQGEEFYVSEIVRNLRRLYEQKMTLAA